MKKSLLLLAFMVGACLLTACGGSGGGTQSGAATHFSVTGPASATAGTVFSVTVSALDAANNVATGYSGRVHFTSTDGQAILPLNPTLASGTGTFTAELETLGTQTLTATDLGTPTITGVTNSISVTVAASRFQVTSQFNATGGTAFSFDVTALDATNKTFTGYSGTVSFTSTDGQAMLPPNSTLTNGKGTFSATLKTAGNQTITVTDAVTASVTGSTSIHVLAPASGFTPTGGMLNAREAHTATLLSDGKVLVVGGAAYENLPFCPGGLTCRPRLFPLASVELFDPASGSFTPTGTMSTPRTLHTATLLGNGKVLVAGGDSAERSSVPLATAEIFDLSTGLFTPTGNMVITRSGHTATLLANGKVLLTGGDGASGNVPSTAELFDPATGEFTPTGNMTAARVFHTATLLSDGRVLLAGGETATAELFDPSTGTFTPTGSMSVARTTHKATLLASGAVLVTGGSGSDGITATAELFDAATGHFTPTGSMATPRRSHTATRLTNGKVLVTGGADANGDLSTAELFDPASGTFTPAGNMETERTGHAATLLVNGDVLITGGSNADNAAKLNSLASAELFP